VRTLPSTSRALRPTSLPTSTARTALSTQREPAAKHYNDSRTPTATKALLDRRRLAALPALSPSPNPRKQHKRHLFERLPSALDAWVRFAGRKSKSPDWAVAATRAAIPRWRDEMVHRGNDPTAGGPAKQFLSAARRAGVDIEDGDALNSFIAGWNARSEAP
jgi:hypothetical protein